MEPWNAQEIKIIAEFDLAPVRESVMHLTEILRVRANGQRRQLYHYLITGFPGGKRATLQRAAESAEHGEGLELVFGDRACHGDHEICSITSEQIERIAGPKAPPKVWPDPQPIEWDSDSRTYLISGPRDAGELIGRVTKGMGSTDSEIEGLEHAIAAAIERGETSGEYISGLTFRVGTACGKPVGSAKWRLRQPTT